MNLLKIKIFRHESPEILETLVNKWLEENKLIRERIIHVKQSSTQYDTVLTIFFKEDKVES